MSSKITIYVARHGKTMMNTFDRVQGWCDSPLTGEGIEVARHLGYGFSDIEFRSAYCSDLRRTKQTAQIVLGAKSQGDIPIVELAGLREACFGSFEADLNHTMWLHAALYLHYRTVEDMYAAILSKELNYKKVLDAIKTLDTAGMAEGFDQIEARTQESLREIGENESQLGDANVLVICHGMSILAMLNSLGGDKLFVRPLNNADVCKVIYQDGVFTVESMADSSYVEKGREAEARAK